jgi:putative endonuclease
MKYQVYILYSKKLNRLYVGHTYDLNKRLLQHNKGESFYTSQGIPWRLLWSSIKDSKSKAEILESKLKNLSRNRKITFMNKYHIGILDIDLFTTLID